MRILNTEELRSVYGGHGKGKHNGKHNACASTRGHNSSRHNKSTRRNASTRRKNATSRHKVARKY